MQSFLTILFNARIVVTEFCILRILQKNVLHAVSIIN